MLQLRVGLRHNTRAGVQHRLIRADLGATQHQRPLAVTLGVHVADQTAKVAALKGLQLTNQLQSLLGGCATNRGGRVNRAGTVQAGQTLLQHAVDRGRQVPKLRGLQQRGHLRHVQLLGDGCQALGNIVDDVGVLVTVLR